MSDVQENKKDLSGPFDNNSFSKQPDEILEDSNISSTEEILSNMKINNRVFNK